MVELARRAGLHCNTVHNLESGHGGQMDTIRLLAEALGVEPGELVKKVGE